MTPLTEKYRPTTLDAVIGNPKAVAVARHAIERGVGGRAVWIAGPTGTGKTTIARIMAQSIADRFSVIEYDSADDFNTAALDRLRYDMTLFSLGKGGRVWIINEAHGLRKPIIRALLGVLERLPSHCAVIFTTTRDGQDQLFEDAIDASPLLSRCSKVMLSNQGLAKVQAARVREIAIAEGLDGQDEAVYLRLAQRSKNNMREQLQFVDDRGMMQ